MTKMNFFFLLVNLNIVRLFPQIFIYSSDFILIHAIYIRVIDKDTIFLFLFFCHFSEKTFDKN